MRRWCLLLLLAACSPSRAPNPAQEDDWPMLGGRPDRNMVSDETGLPTKWSADKNVLWSAELGKQTYGNPVISGGRVFIGTNNGHPRDGAIKGDKGVLMCFSEKDGSFLWQAVHDKLKSGGREDWPEIGICSTPCVVGDRVYYVSNRAELICCDAAGFTDNENDGPFKDEKRSGKQDVDIVWILDMRKALGVSPYQASSSSPLVVGDLLFVLTGQGIDTQTGDVKNPKAPSFLAVNRKTGKVEWQNSSPGDKILEGQWASPAYGIVDGKPQVTFPGGDGVLYAFEPKTGKLLWKFDCKQNEKKITKNHFVASPVYVGNQVVISVGANPEEGADAGCLWAIDARNGKELWRYAGQEFGSSTATVAVHDGLVYAVEIDGILHCVDLKTGKRVWKHDLLSTVWGSPFVADGRVYIRNGDEEVVILKAGREKKVIGKNQLPGLFQGTPVVANGVLYLAADARLYAIKEKTK